MLLKSLFTGRKDVLLMTIAAMGLLFVAGCGGVSDADTTTTTTTGTTPAATTSAAIDTSALRKIPTPSTLDIKAVDKTVNKYPDEFTVNIGFKPNGDTPSFFTDALKKAKPIFVEFYGDGDSLSNRMAQDISELQQKYSGTVTFILLNADKPQTYGSLSEQLPVQYVPQVFIFNGESTIIRSYTGYTDKERLDQALYDAVNRGY